MKIENLLAKGYMCEELPPPFNSLLLGEKYGQINRAITSKPLSDLPTDTICTDFLAPKIGIHRRHFSIPHPYPQIKISETIVRNWGNIETQYAKSKSSKSTPEISLRGIRSIVYLDKYEDFRESCIKASATKKYELHIDIAKYFFSIYTHSIPWAIHTKPTAKADPTSRLWGNEIDKYIRWAQSKQTKGIPIGTDTSRIVAELIGSAIDVEFEKTLKKFKIEPIGFRFVDDCRYFFDSLADAERALKEYQKILIGYSLQLNDEKTKIVRRPSTFDNSWKTILNTVELEQIEDGYTKKQRNAIKNYFNLLLELANAHPTDSVIKYGVKRLHKLTAHPKNIDIFEPLLYNLVLCEAIILPDALKILDKHKRFLSMNKLEEFIRQLIIQNVHKGHHFEVSWALWYAKHFNLKITGSIAKEILETGDVISTIVLLDVYNSKLIEGRVSFAALKKELSLGCLSNERWILAYEAEFNKWLPLKNISHDTFFSTLKKNRVNFYDPNAGRKTGKIVKKSIVTKKKPKTKSSLIAMTSDYL